jgi:hypothetical protein
MEAIESTTLLKLRAFIGDVKVKKIEDLFGSLECGVFVVVGWFVSVVEGVDMWYPALSMISGPRYIDLFLKKKFDGSYFLECLCN